MGRVVTHKLSSRWFRKASAAAVWRIVSCLQPYAYTFHGDAVSATSRLLPFFSSWTASTIAELAPPPRVVPPLDSAFHADPDSVSSVGDGTSRPEPSSPGAAEPGTLPAPIDPVIDQCPQEQAAITELQSQVCYLHSMLTNVLQILNDRLPLSPANHPSSIVTNAQCVPPVLCPGPLHGEAPRPRQLAPPPPPPVPRCVPPPPPPPPPRAAIPPRPNYPGVRSRTNWEPLPHRRPNWKQRGSQQCRSCGNEAPAECVDHACWACCSCFNCPYLYHANHASSSVHAPVNSPCHPPPPPPPPPAPPYGRNRQAASGSSVSSVSYVRPPLRRRTGNAVGARR